MGKLNLERPLQKWGASRLKAKGFLLVEISPKVIK
jgi:hypothetical protein